MSPRGQLALYLPVAVLWLVLALAGHSARGHQDPQQTSTLGGAMRYIHDLDKYYTQVARPSTRSDPLTYDDDDGEYFKASQALRMMKLNELNRFYTQRSRPRFGKRTEFHVQTEERDTVFNPRQRQLHKWVRSEVPFKEIPSITSVWADGTILCVLVENAIAPNPHTKFHLDKYQNFGHVTLPSIRLGQQLARQYLFVDPEFSNDEMQREADAEIIQRLVKYLQNVKKASKLAKTKKPFEINERRPSTRGITEAARKRKIVRQKRRSKTPEKAALNYSLVSSTVIPESKTDESEVSQLQTMLQDDLFSKCNEIQSVCEMLLVRSNKRKSLQIFNTATQILSTRKGSVSQEEKLRLTEEIDEKNEANCKKNGPQGDEKQRRLSQQKIVVSSFNVETIAPIRRKSSVDAGKGRGSRRNSVQKEEPNEKKPPKIKTKPNGLKLDFSKTDFSRIEEMSKNRRNSVENVVQKMENLASDIANMNVIDDSSNGGVFFARRLSQSFNIFEDEFKQAVNENHRKDLSKKQSTKNANIVRPEFNSGVFKARRDAFLSPVSKSEPGTQEKGPAREKRKKSLGASLEDTKKRYDLAKNFFKTMEQQSCSFERRTSEFVYKEVRRGSESLAVNPEPAEYQHFSSCRSTRSPPSKLHVADVFCQGETTQKTAKTINVPDMSAVMASLNSAYNENEIRPRSPYAMVREGNEEDDSEPPSPDRQTLDCSRRRVSYSQLNQEGDAGIF